MRGTLLCSALKLSPCLIGFKITLYTFIQFQALVSVFANRGVLYFDEQVIDGRTPTYSWTKMMPSPLDAWDNYPGLERISFHYEPLTVVAGETLYVGAIMDSWCFGIHAKYNMNSGEWDDLDNENSAQSEAYDYDGAPPSMIELDGFIYLIGGANHYSDSWRKSIVKYDIARNCWVECCDLKSGVQACHLIIVEKKVLILDLDWDEENGVVMQMYDPAIDESFIVLEAAGLEKDCLKSKDLIPIVTVQSASGLCYLVCDDYQDYRYINYSDVDESDIELSGLRPTEEERNPLVFKLVCDLDSNPPSVVLGEEIPQSHPHRNNFIRAFILEDKTFVNVHECVHKIKDGIANEDDLEKWRNVTKTSYSPVYFTFDRREFSHSTEKKGEDQLRVDVSSQTTNPVNEITMPSSSGKWCIVL